MQEKVEIAEGVAGEVKKEAIRERSGAFYGGNHSVER